LNYVLKTYLSLVLCIGGARTAAFDRVGKLRQSLSVVPDRMPVYLQIAKLLMQARIVFFSKLANTHSLTGLDLMEQEPGECL
jgi:hypothetical protein